MKAMPDELRAPAQYRGNPLIDACGDVLPPNAIVNGLVHLPPIPIRGEFSERHLIEHELFVVRRLHVPTAEGVSIAQTIDLLLRQGYVHRCPSEPSTWRDIYRHDRPADDGVQLAASVVGLSGAGKSTALERALRLRPQVVVHERFPNLVGPVRQLVWLKSDVPSSGKLKDLVETLAYAADEVLGTDHAPATLKGRSRSGESLAREWLRRMACHFPGLLVLDEIQNLFKIETKSVRRTAGARDERPLLRIVDDEALKLLLTLTNTNKFPLVVCGTPDGMSAFGTRMSTSQRLVTGGFHRLEHAAAPDDKFFSRRLLPRVFDYQWLPDKLLLDAEALALIHGFTAGLPRLCASLWIHAHRRALSVNAKGLTLDHLKHAAAHALSTVQPAVQALLSQNPSRMRMFEDLLPTCVNW